MNRKIEIALPLVLVAAVLAFVLFVKAPDEPRDLRPEQQTVESSLAQETTIRNVTDRTLTYRIYPAERPEDIQTKELAPGTIDRIRTDAVLEIEFNNGEEDLIYSLDPGTPYSFRFDAGPKIDLFLGAHGRADAEDLAPYVPTPMAVVEEMLRLADLNENDIVYDLGCGDGRIVITAAKEYGVRGVGIDIDEKMIEDSRANARTAGVEDLVSFIQMDATKADISEATVLTLYLLPESNALLRPMIEEQLNPGARVVCHNYSIPGWEAKESQTATIKDENGEEHYVIAYVR